MIIAAEYSFNGGKIVRENYADQFREITEVIASVRNIEHKTKISKEKTKEGRLLYKPKSLNSDFNKHFTERGWAKQDIPCNYVTQCYVDDYKPSSRFRRTSREIDFVKNRVGVEIQFGKYSFMVYDVCAKMVIFHKLSRIDIGVEIVPIKDFATEMSTGVSYFEQFVWDLEQRGVSNIDIPVLVLGVMADRQNSPTDPVPPLLG